MKKLSQKVLDQMEQRKLKPGDPVSQPLHYTSTFKNHKPPLSTPHQFLTCDNNMCSICVEDYQVNDLLRILPCKLVPFTPYHYVLYQSISLHRFLLCTYDTSWIFFERGWCWQKLACKNRLINLIAIIHANRVSRHSFHLKCVDGWLIKNRRCPICQADILTHSQFLVRFWDAFCFR